jgi:chemotaxis signal transduction protein
MTTPNSYVLFPLGERRFALPAQLVSELALPGRLQEFPHTTPMLAGVLVRRGRIVPVCDVAPVLVGPDAPARRFYLIAKNEDGESTAIPVSGECELISAIADASEAAARKYVTGTLQRDGRAIPVIDLNALLTSEVRA